MTIVSFQHGSADSRSGGVTIALTCTPFPLEGCQIIIPTQLVRTPDLTNKIDNMEVATDENRLQLFLCVLGSVVLFDSINLQ